MKISSEHINNLLAYARERHGAPCRVTFTAWGDMVEVAYAVQDWATVELIDIPNE